MPDIVIEDHLLPSLSFFTLCNAESSPIGAIRLDDGAAGPGGPASLQNWQGVAAPRWAGSTPVPLRIRSREGPTQRSMGKADPLADVVD